MEANILLFPKSLYSRVGFLFGQEGSALCCMLSHFSHVQLFVTLWTLLWELDYKESWAPKNWCFWTVVLEKTLGSPLDCKEIQPVHPGGNQSWIFIGRTDAEAETPILWSPGAKNWLIWKDPDAGNDWRREEKGWQRMRSLDGITDSTDMSLVSSRSWLWTGKPGLLQSMGLQRVGHDWATELNWTELNLPCIACMLSCFSHVWLCVTL